MRTKQWNRDEPSILHSFSPSIFWQTLRIWFENEFLLGNAKLETVRQLRCDDASVFHDKDSVERRLLSSLCYEYGNGLYKRFPFDSTDKSSATKFLKTRFRKLAHQLFWFQLKNLHHLQDAKVFYGDRQIGLKAICCAWITNAFSKAYRK